jgi:pantoate--beta-alanine ligase
VFVNPLQFGPDEDLSTYPRDLPGDLDKLREAGVDSVFVPSREAFVPPDLATTVSVSGVTEMLEGVHRPGHFVGVATIVTKLLHVAQPSVAFFGEKDYQQLVTIRRLVSDLDLPVEIVGVPIVREPDGLAMSSRNVYLSGDERTRALVLSRALRHVAGAWNGDADAARAELRAALAAAPGVAPDYADVVDEHTLVALTGSGHRCARAVVAARVGTTRLIDNVVLELRPIETRRNRPTSNGPEELRSTPNGPEKLRSTDTGPESLRPRTDELGGP